MYYLLTNTYYHTKMGSKHSKRKKKNNKKSTHIKTSIDHHVKTENIGHIVHINDTPRDKIIYYLECCSIVLREAGVIFNMDMLKRDTIQNMAGAAGSLFDIQTMISLKVFRLVDKLKSKNLNDFIKETKITETKIEINNVKYETTKQFNPTKINCITKKWCDTYYTEPLREINKNVKLTKYNKIFMLQQMGILAMPNLRFAPPNVGPPNVGPRIIIRNRNGIIKPQNTNAQYRNNNVPPYNPSAPPLHTEHPPSYEEACTN